VKAAKGSNTSIREITIEKITPSYKAGIHLPTNARRGARSPPAPKLYSQLCLPFKATAIGVKTSRPDIILLDIGAIFSAFPYIAWRLSSCQGVRVALNHHPHHHFLLVENDASEAEILDKAFAAIPDCGTVAIARNISEAKAYLKGAGIYSNRDKFRVPSTILASWRLDGDSGVDLLAWVKSDENLRRIPFVLLTPAAASPREVAEAKAIAAVRVARKPGNSDDLKSMLEKLAETMCSEADD
jgi:CheY-like chemotaxis protein